MRDKLIRLVFLSVLVFAASHSASAQIYVTVRPNAPVIVRPLQPGPSYVWVNEEWEPYRDSYRYSAGHWASPPHAGYYRKNGYWKHTNKGHVWIKGDWHAKKSSYNGKNNGHSKGKHKGKHKH